jgi:hypothetical protein
MDDATAIKLSGYARPSLPSTLVSRGIVRVLSGRRAFAVHDASPLSADPGRFFPDFGPRSFGVARLSFWVLERALARCSARHMSGPAGGVVAWPR